MILHKLFNFSEASSKTDIGMIDQVHVHLGILLKDSDDVFINSFQERAQAQPPTATDCASSSPRLGKSGGSARAKCHG